MEKELPKRHFNFDPRNIFKEDPIPQFRDEKCKSGGAFYHYTTLEIYKKIMEPEDGQLKLGFTRVCERLYSHHSHRDEVRPQVGQKAIFGVLDEHHPEWVEYDFDYNFPLISSIILSLGHSPVFYENEKVVKLKINTDTLREVYVADWGHYLPEHYFPNSGLTAEYIYQSGLGGREPYKANLRYAKSIVHIDDYQNNYTIPEVLCILMTIKIIIQFPKFYA